VFPLNNQLKTNSFDKENYSQQNTNCSTPVFTSMSVAPLAANRVDELLTTNRNIQSSAEQPSCIIVADVFATGEFKKTNTQRAIIATSIELTDVKEDDDNKGGKYNGSNHWVNNVRPSDYDAVQENLKTSNWVKELKETYEEITIPVQHVKTLFGAYRVSLCKGTSWINGNISNTSASDLNDIFNYPEDYEAKTGTKRIAEIKAIIETETKLKEKFARTDYASFKNTRWRKEYNTSLRKMYESLILSDLKHSPLSYQPANENSQHDATDLKVYLFPWQDIDSDREFRVFVYNNKITAISQQNLYQSNEVLAASPTSEDRAEKIKHWCDIIEGYFLDKIRTKIKYISSYVLDIAIIDKDRKEVAYPIELNPFGKEYTSGSSLFNWITDQDILYSDNTENLHFRYVV
jgi:hypothetical protein